MPRLSGQPLQCPDQSNSIRLPLELRSSGSAQTSVPYCLHPVPSSLSLDKLHSPVGSIVPKIWSDSPWMDIQMDLHASGFQNKSGSLYTWQSACQTQEANIYSPLGQGFQDIKPSGQLLTKKINISHYLAGRSATFPNDIRKMGCVFFPPAGSHILYRSGQPVAQSSLQSRSHCRPGPSLWCRQAGRQFSSGHATYSECDFGLLTVPA